MSTVNDPLLPRGAINSSMPDLDEGEDLGDVQASHIFYDDDSDRELMNDPVYKKRNTVFKTKDPLERQKLPKDYLGNNREEPDVLSR